MYVAKDQRSYRYSNVKFEKGISVAMNLNAETKYWVILLSLYQIPSKYYFNLLNSIDCIFCRNLRSQPS